MIRYESLAQFYIDVGTFLTSLTSVVLFIIYNEGNYQC